MVAKESRSSTDAALPFLNYNILDGKEVRAGFTGDPTFPFKTVVLGLYTFSANSPRKL